MPPEPVDASTRGLIGSLSPRPPVLLDAGVESGADRLLGVACQATAALVDDFTEAPVTLASSKIEIPAASASVAKRVAELVGRAALPPNARP